jgi:hypothetical protein
MILGVFPILASLLLLVFGLLISIRTLYSMLQILPCFKKPISSSQNMTVLSTPCSPHFSTMMKRVALMAKSIRCLSEAIIIDTGCSQHMFSKRELFVDLTIFTPQEAAKRAISGIGSSTL